MTCYLGNLLVTPDFQWHQQFLPKLSLVHKALDSNGSKAGNFERLKFTNRKNIFSKEMMFYVLTIQNKKNFPLTISLLIIYRIQNLNKYILITLFMFLYIARSGMSVYK